MKNKSVFSPKNCPTRGHFWHCLHSHRPYSETPGDKSSITLSYNLLLYLLSFSLKLQFFLQVWQLPSKKAGPNSTLNSPCLLVAELLKKEIRDEESQTCRMFLNFLLQLFGDGDACLMAAHLNHLQSLKGRPNDTPGAFRLGPNWVHSGGRNSRAGNKHAAGFNGSGSGSNDRWAGVVVRRIQTQNLLLFLSPGHLCDAFCWIFSHF